MVREQVERIDFFIFINLLKHFNSTKCALLLRLFQIFFFYFRSFVRGVLYVSFFFRHEVELDITRIAHNPHAYFMNRRGKKNVPTFYEMALRKVAQNKSRVSMQLHITAQIKAS